MFNQLATGRYWDRPWGLVQGCTPVSSGCLNCWSAAEAHMRQFQKNPKIRNQYQGLTTKINGVPTFNGTVRLRLDRLDLPLRTRKPTAWAIWTDLGHEAVPDSFRAQVLDIMCSADCEHHIFMVVTKRPEDFVDFFQRLEMPGDSPLGACLEVRGWLPRNIWFIVTAETQDQADKRIPFLLQIPAVIGVSLEPMLGPVDLSLWLPMIDWIICGGETGHRARPMHPVWPRLVLAQCQATGVPFFFKQWGEWREGSDRRYKTLCVYDDGRLVEFTKEAILALEKRSGIYCQYAYPTLMSRVGKTTAGRLLDGRAWNEMPHAGGRYD